MTERMLNGEEALAHGALACGVKLATSYPGSPSSGVIDTLIELAPEHDLYVEWSANEKVAMEMGIGASIAGRRALVCVKSVGMNAMVDPLMALNLTPVHGGLVIVLGDDPGAYGSQNDQDTRPLATLLEMPMLEPASPAEACAMMREAFAISEKYHTAVIVRETRAFTQQKEMVNVSSMPGPPANMGLVRESLRFVPVPKNAVAKHKALHETMAALADWADGAGYNRIVGKGAKGIVAAGFAYRKLLDALAGEIPEDLRLLKLGVLNPLPRKTIVEFLNGCQEVLVVEENEPYIEAQLKAIAHDEGCGAKIYGKQSGCISREGELFRWQIQQALARFLPEFTPGKSYLPENESEEIPPKESFCGGCRYDEVLDCLNEAAASLGRQPLIVGDPGCLVTVAERLDAKYAIGSAVGVADGFSKAGGEERAVAIFGDSAFFHTALPAICNAVHNRSEVLIVVLDNKATATSGFQTNPGVGRDAYGRAAPALDIAQIALACGVSQVLSADLDDSDPSLSATFRKALGQTELTLVIVRIRALNQD